MSQNGPYAGPAHPAAPNAVGDGHLAAPEGGYAPPADPWTGHDPWPGHTGASPYEPGYGNPGAGPWPAAAQPAARRGNGLVMALVGVLSMLVVGGVAGTAFLLAREDDRDARPVLAATHPPAQEAAVSSDAADARFVAAGQCVRNEGSEDVPRMRVTACAGGSFEVLKRIDGITTGEKDAQVKCAKVSGYTNWYFYDSELDGLDFVLCLRAR
jgi:hypothetical protein